MFLHNDLQLIIQKQMSYDTSTSRHTSRAQTKEARVKFTDREKGVMISPIQKIFHHIILNLQHQYNKKNQTLKIFHFKMFLSRRIGNIVAYNLTKHTK